MIMRDFSISSVVISLNFLKMKIQIKPFCSSTSFHIQRITSSKTLNIKEKTVVIVMPSNDRINQLKKESAVKMSFL